MAIIRKWSGDGLSAGTLTTATAGSGDNAFDQVTGTVTVEATGTRSPRLQFPLSSTQNRVGWYITSTQVLSTRHYMEWNALPPQGVAIVYGATAVHTVQSFKLEITSGGNLRIRDASNTLLADSSGAMSAGVVYRIEVTLNVGAMTAKAYVGETNTVQATVSGTVGTDHDMIRFGAAFNVANEPQHWFDDLAIGNTAVEIGPVSPPSNVAPTVTAGAQQTVPAGTNVTLTHSASDSDGSISSRLWTLLSYAGSTDPAPNPTIVNATSSSGTSVLLANPGIYVFQILVTDNGTPGLTDTDTTTVRVMASGAGAIKVASVESNPGGWTNVGGATTVANALNDASDATYQQSSTGTVNPSKLRVKIDPLATPTTFQLDPKVILDSAGAGTAYVRLFEGATQRKQWTITPTTTASTPALTLTGPEIATVTDWASMLDIEIEWGV